MAWYDTLWSYTQSVFYWYWMQWNREYPTVNWPTYSEETHSQCFTECNETGNIPLWTDQHTLKRHTVSVLLNAVRQEISHWELNNTLWSYTQSVFYWYWMQWNREYPTVNWPTYSEVTHSQCFTHTECCKTGNVLWWTEQHTLKLHIVNVLLILNAVKYAISECEPNNILWSYKFYLYWMHWNRESSNMNWTTYSEVTNSQCFTYTECSETGNLLTWTGQHTLKS